MTSKNYNPQLIGLAMLLASGAQWWFFEYIDESEIIFGNFSVCVMSLVIALSGIMIFRFFECLIIPLILRIFIALILVELATIGLGYSICRTERMTLVVCIALSIAFFALLSYVGALMMTTERVAFVGLLCLLSFLTMIICTLVLTLFLVLESKVSYIRVFIISTYLPLLFNVAYDSHKLYCPERDSISFDDSLRYGIYLYGQYIALLQVTLAIDTHN